jgi:IS605 OrfB family transposase
VGGLRDWRGVKPVAAPAGTAITTRLRTTAAEDLVLGQVAALLGMLRRGDLAAACRPEAGENGAEGDVRRAKRSRLNARKALLTDQSSSRWASSVIRGNDAQVRLAHRSQARRITFLKAAIAAIEERLAAPSADRPTVRERRERRDRKLPRGYASQAERFQKQRRLQHLKAGLARAEADHAAGVVHVTEGGKRLARNRHHLATAGQAGQQWREEWEAARWRVEANGSRDEPYGNLTITVTPDGTVSLRLPRPLEHLANAPRGRYVLSGRAVFSYRGGEWRDRVTGGKSVSYAITRRPGRAGVYLTGSWGYDLEPAPGGDVTVAGPVIGVDLNDGHLAVRRLDAHGNPTGRPHRIDFSLSGPAGRRDAQVRHAVTRLLRYARRHGIAAIALEDLNFADARDIGRETMGRGQRGKRFRRTVSGLPVGTFRTRLAGMAARHGITPYAVNPAYTSVWGGQYWQSPYNVTRHEAAATVIGRRAQGHKARRRRGVTPAPPEDGAVRAARQARPHSTGRVLAGPRDRTRGTTSRRPDQARTPLARRATVIPAKLTSNGQLPNITVLVSLSACVPR